eukprot:6175993-Pleurochrysis_carterae.AAC.1
MEAQKLTRYCAHVHTHTPGCTKKHSDVIPRDTRVTRRSIFEQNLQTTTTTRIHVSHGQSRREPMKSKEGRARLTLPASSVVFLMSVRCTHIRRSHSTTIASDAADANSDVEASTTPRRQGEELVNRETTCAQKQKNGVCARHARESRTEVAGSKKCQTAWVMGSCSEPKLRATRINAVH